MTKLDEQPLFRVRKHILAGLASITPEEIGVIKSRFDIDISTMTSAEAERALLIIAEEILRTRQRNLN